MSGSASCARVKLVCIGRSLSHKSRYMRPGLRMRSRIEALLDPRATSAASAGGRRLEDRRPRRAARRARGPASHGRRRRCAARIDRGAAILAAPRSAAPRARAARRPNRRNARHRQLAAIRRTTAAPSAGGSDSAPDDRAVSAGERRDVADLLPERAPSCSLCSSSQRTVRGELAGAAPRSDARPRAPALRGAAP